MNKKQWYWLGIGLFVIGLILLSLRGPICMGGGDLLVACIIRRYAFAVPGLILLFLGVVFNVISWFVKDKKNEK